MFHCMSGIEGGGQDTVAWVSWPPPWIFMILKYEMLLYVKEELRLF